METINYLEVMRFHYGEEELFICGYEAGCLGFTLYHELTAHSIKCVILASSTIPTASGKKRISDNRKGGTPAIIRLESCATLDDLSTADNC